MQKWRCLPSGSVGFLGAVGVFGAGGFLAATWGGGSAKKEKKLQLQ